MNNPLDRALIEARIVRYLLVEGRPCDFMEIRIGGELTAICRTMIWAALGSLVKSGLVATTRATKTEDHGDFPSSITYPVFWVDRASITSERVQPAGKWWHGYLDRTMRGEVQS